mmetsp:Transcript_67786/g.219331  ORF Transcript_67786/g.219331 Transcript_67786/m.219331 type:complete len:86 (+) Transcript_67786:400-657(+)
MATNRLAAAPEMPKHAWPAARLGQNRNERSPAITTRHSHEAAAEAPASFEALSTVPCSECRVGGLLSCLIFLHLLDQVCVGTRAR